MAHDVCIPSTMGHFRPRVCTPTLDIEAGSTSWGSIWAGRGMPTFVDESINNSPLRLVRKRAFVAVTENELIAAFEFAVWVAERL
jgi:hypothetical protein